MRSSNKITGCKENRRPQVKAAGAGAETRRRRGCGKHGPEQFILEGGAMAAWFGPAVRAVLPYVGAIVAAALPVFTTKKSDDAVAAQVQLMQKQIDELQAAATQNAAHIKELAKQLEKTVAAFEQAAAAAESGYRRTAALGRGAIIISCIALGVSCIALFGR
jgi:hypothetical protein